MKINRDFPKIEASNLKWIGCFLLIIFSIIVTETVFEILKIDSVLLGGVSLSFFSIIFCLVIDKNFIKKTFLPLTWRDLIYIVLGLFIIFILVIISSVIASYFKFEGDSNPIIGYIKDMDTLVLISSTWIQFIGEELIFVVPFLFVINKFKRINYNLRVFLALFISSIIFGAMHIGTYNNIIQAVVLISFLRLGMSMSYVMSRNLTVSFVIHGIYDWILICLSLNADKFINLIFHPLF